ncbi:TPA: serine/threonine-protein kinase [Raoultella planticola]
MEEQHGNYFVQRISTLGRGAFGYVEHVKVYNLNKGLCGDYARKFLSPVKPEIVEQIEQFKRRFKREVIYQSNCTHSNIVPIYLCSLYAETPWFIMEKAECDLDHEISNNLLSPDQKLMVAKMILDGIGHIHKKGYLHRDIKPVNVLKFSDGTYKVSDFGLVKDTNPKGDTIKLTAIGTKMGSPRYMAPEILYNAEYSAQTDIYAVGRLIEDLNIEDKKVKPIITKCIKMEKDARYQSITEILLDFSELIQRSKS